MSDWYVDYWKPDDASRSPVQKDLLEMIRSCKPAQKQLSKLIRGVQEFGPHGYKMPNNENLGGGLYELRDTVNHFRYYYYETDFCYVLPDGKKSIVLLMVLAEDDKDKQQHHIVKARTRMVSLIEGNLLNESEYKICDCEEDEDGCS